MKQLKKLIGAIAIGIIFASCSSDSDSFNPYENQEKAPLYPKTLTYKNHNDNSRTTENWTFAYNADNSIKEFSYNQTITTGNLRITETQNATLNYGTDLEGNKLIKSEIEVNYKSSDLTDSFQYKDNITETVRFEDGNIVKIESHCKRTSDNKEENSYSEWSFSYSNDFCTGAVFKSQNETNIYTYEWSGERLAKVIINGEHKSGDLRNEIFEYSYNTKNLIKDYGFNPMAFVYGHMPMAYAAMGFFGKETPYLLEVQTYELSVRNPNVNNGYPYQEKKLTRDYRIEDNSSSITIKVDSDTNNQSEYYFSR